MNTFKDRATKLETPVFQRAHSLFFFLHPTQLEACVNNIQKLAYFSKGYRLRFCGKQKNELANGCGFTDVAWETRSAISLLLLSLIVSFKDLLYLRISVIVDLKENRVTTVPFRNSALVVSDLMKTQLSAENRMIIETVIQERFF